MVELSEEDKEKLRIEKLITEINTRENSTLVLSTVASSVSIAILATLFDKSIDVRVSWGAFGALFALLGFVYREMTIHFSEMKSYRELRQKLHLPHDVSFLLYLRMVIVRWFLLLPLAVFLTLICSSSVVVWMVGALILSSTFSMVELIRRVDC